MGQEQDTLEGPAPGDTVDRILSRINDYAKARGHRISMVAVSGPLDPILAPPPPGLEVDDEAGASFMSRIWLDLDAIPFLALCKDTQFSLAGEAVHAVELALEQLGPTTTSIMKASVSPSRREVLGTFVIYSRPHVFDTYPKSMPLGPFICTIFVSNPRSPRQASGARFQPWRFHSLRTESMSPFSRQHHAEGVWP